MEYVIVSALAFLGNSMAKNGKAPRYKNKHISVEESQNKYPFKRTPLSDQFKEKILEPGYNWQPHYSKIGGMQNKGGAEVLEGFHGSEAPKAEVENMFVPAKQNIYGAPAESDAQRQEDLRMYGDSLPFGSAKQSEQLPKMQVGPGLGLKPDDPAAGGYQQFYRIRPEEFNSYKKHTYTGKLILGKAVNNKQMLQGEVGVYNRNPTVTENAAVKFQGKSGTSASYRTSDPTLQGTNRGTASNKYGGASAQGYGIRTTQYGTRDKDSTVTGTVQNLSGTTSHPINSQEYGAPSGFRGKQGVIINAHANTGTVVQNHIPLSNTARQTTNSSQTIGVKGANAPMDSTVSEQAPTLRQDSRGYFPGAGRMNVLEDPTQIVKNLEMKDDNNLEVVGNPGRSGATFINQLGQVELNDVYDQPPQDLNLAQKQLRQNPYNKSII